MKIRQHYLALRNYYPKYKEQEPLEITTLELAEVLDCTHRNMVLLLKRMQQEQWLSWESRRGRGNRSVLQFLARKEDIALQEAQEIAEKQDLQSAISYLQTMDEGTHVLRQQFQEWLSGRFGFHSELQGERRMDILRFPLPQRIHSLDPASIHYSGESHLANQLYDGLVRMSAAGDTISPHLAHAWEVDESRTVWTFYLRKGVLFHHGTEMLGADVKYALERLQTLAPKGLFNWVYMKIIRIETPDERTVRMTLSEPNELFLAFLTTNRASIVPAPNRVQDDALHQQQYSSIGTKPIGTGPFRLMEQVSGVFVLEAFPSYFQGRGFLDRVEVWSQPGDKPLDEAEELASFQVMHNVRLSKSAASRWQQVRQSGMTCKFITVNELRDGPLSIAAVREALDLALDRSELITRLSGDVIERADSFWPQAADRQMDSSESSVDTTIAITDIEAIKERVRASGYQGEPIVLATIPQYETDALIVQQVCEDAGITIAIKLIEAELFKGEERLSADLLLFAIMLDEHRELRLIDLYTSMQHHRKPHMRLLLQKQIADILTERSPLRRAAAFLELEKQLLESHSLLFLYRKHLKTAFHPSIRGISLESLGWVRFRDLWFTR
ncbi:ABC transporter substrate-binding protein [Paenibacillus sp. OV219]|uniref:ABC transporter substrate-binding protein n=1 Tax=Paenibacillus sp. OV219 TaxID=1884377 RepID=UPI0008C4A627|nr:ABC transporter substrate-binding protein [Paenibacillus sp. OV219]SEM91166.1 DNA-binding transcriptional regulator SgrR of sgrS sRNA, contains a MarR-type HTH domain and a solute-binding domain [Paenibacillus sp. OV219]